MTAIHYWPENLPSEISIGFSGHPQEATVSFQPDIGPSIDRRVTTGTAQVCNIHLPRLALEQFDTFEAWFTDDLKSGVEKFTWREPLSRKVWEWKFMASGGAPYQWAAISKSLVGVSFTLMRLPAAPWFASYVRDGTSKPPAFVADYDAGVYGIDGAKVPASSLPSVAGTYDLYTVNGLDVETFAAAEVLTAGDIPEAQPVDVKRYVGFSV